MKVQVTLVPKSPSFNGLRPIISYLAPGPPEVGTRVTILHPDGVLEPYRVTGAEQFVRVRSRATDPGDTGEIEECLVTVEPA